MGMVSIANKLNLMLELVSHIGYFESDSYTIMLEAI